MTNFSLLARLAQNLPAAIARKILPGYVEFREVGKSEVLIHANILLN